MYIKRLLKWGVGFRFMGKANEDWIKIRKEYITDERTSYRTLAQKYGVSYVAIGKRARAEGWKQQRDECVRKSLTKYVESASTRNAERLNRLQNVADKLIDKVEEVINRSDFDVIVTNSLLRQMSGALKDIKDVQNLKSDLDIKEQEARIKNLERQTQSADEVNEIKVTITGEADEYSE